MPNQLLTAEEVAEMLGFNVEYVWRLAREHKIDVFILGRKIRRFTPDAVQKFIKDYTVTKEEAEHWEQEKHQTPQASDNNKDKPNTTIKE
jgi:excisionase family DNA binding protein